MKVRNVRWQIVGLILFCAASIFTLTGCKTTPKIDWNSRVHNYTYDQAVAELGLPDKSAKLSDGQTVAEWYKRSTSSGLSLGIGTGFSGRHSSVGVGQSFATGSGVHVLRLVFGADNKLASWTKNY